MQAATTQYHLRNFDAAEDLFEDLLNRDPHRIEVTPLDIRVDTQQSCSWKCKAIDIGICMSKVHHPNLIWLPASASHAFFSLLPLTFSLATHNNQI